MIARISRNAFQSRMVACVRHVRRGTSRLARFDKRASAASPRLGPAGPYRAEVAGNDLHDPASLLGFWEELAPSLPTEPSDAKVVGVRTWLVNRVADARDSVDGSRGAVSLQSYDPGVTAMLAYAVCRATRHAAR